MISKSAQRIRKQIHRKVLCFEHAKFLNFHETNPNGMKTEVQKHYKASAVLFAFWGGQSSKSSISDELFMTAVAYNYL